MGNRTLTVAGVLKDSPFSASDQPTVICSEELFQEPTVICSEELFQEITGQDGYAVLDVQLTKDAGRQDVEQLHGLASGKYSFYDRLDLNRDTKNTYFMFCLFVYGFLFVVTLITIIHTANSIAMSVSSTPPTASL